MKINKDKIEQDRFKEINKHCKGTILDLGGHQGGLNSYLRKHNQIVFCADIVKSKNVDFVVNLNDNEWYKNIEYKFDTIVGAELIEHLHNPTKFINECKNLLTPNGRLIITTPNASSLIYMKNDKWAVRGFGVSKTLFHRQTFTKGMIETIMMEANFKIIDSYYINAFLYNPIAYYLAKYFKRLRGDMIVVGVNNAKN